MSCYLLGKERNNQSAYSERQTATNKFFFKLGPLCEQLIGDFFGICCRLYCIIFDADVVGCSRTFSLEVASLAWSCFELY